MAKFDTIFRETATVKKPEPHPRWETKWIHYTKLTDHKKQYCDEHSPAEIENLAALIDADKGVQQNLIVRKTNTDEYEIIAGHKRRRACKWLVEQEGKKQYEFLPCLVENITDVQAEFRLYSSNRFHEKTEYEKMHELERMKYLLENYPEEFPHLQTGRMVERIASQMGLKRTTVGEYLNISKNLGKKGKEEFRKGSLKKSAAVELAALPEKEQEELLEQGASYREIKAYKEEKRERETCEENICTAYQEEETQIAGQYKVANIDMDIEKDVPKSGTQNEEENVPKSGTQSEEENVPKSGTQNEEYTPEYFLQEQKEKLEELLVCKKKGGVVSEKIMERQRVLVSAMEFYVSHLCL